VFQDPSQYVPDRRPRPSRPAVAVLWILYWILAAFLLAGGLALFGCRGRVEGGSSLEDRRGVIVRVTPDSLEVTDDRAYVATTQPSAPAGEQISLGGVDGILSSMKSIPYVERFRHGWHLGLVCLAAAVFTGWYLKRYLLGILLGSFGVVAILYPPAALWISLGAFGLSAWASWRMNREQIAGTANVLEKVNPETGEAYKAAMRSRHSPATQAAIKAATGKK
jgi:hypothetical protein